MCVKIKEVLTKGDDALEFFNGLWSIIKTIQIRDVIDILAIALIIFAAFRFIRETRAVQLLKGFCAAFSLCNIVAAGICDAVIFVENIF